MAVKHIDTTHTIKDGKLVEVEKRKPRKRKKK